MTNSKNEKRNSIANIYIFLSATVFVFGCGQIDNINGHKYNLLFTNHPLKSFQYVYSDSSINDNTFFVNEEIFVKDDSTSIYSLKRFKKRNSNNIQKVTLIYDFNNKIIDTIFTPFLTLYNDTCFLYYYPLQYPLTVPATSEDYIFINRHLQNYNLYIMAQVPVGISTYSMVYFYDCKFNIYKIIYVVKNEKKEYYFEFLRTNLNGISRNDAHYLKEENYPEIKELIKDNKCLIEKKTFYFDSIIH